MKLNGPVAVAVIAVLLGGVEAAGEWRTRATQGRQEAKEFKLGVVPSPILEGKMKGTVGTKSDWLGKRFESGKERGINVFEEGGKEVEKYPFRTYIGPGLVDPEISVVKIDYNLPENPWWLRMVVDEVVETEQGKYLGKLNIRLGRIKWALGYFRLERIN